MHRAKSIEHASDDLGQASDCDIVFERYRTYVCMNHSCYLWSLIESVKSQVPQGVVLRTLEQNQVQYSSAYGGQVVPQVTAPHVHSKQCMYVHCIDAPTVYVIKYIKSLGKYVKISYINCHFS